MRGEGVRQGLGSRVRGGDGRRLHKKNRDVRKDSKRFFAFSPSWLVTQETRVRRAGSECHRLSKRQRVDKEPVEARGARASRGRAPGRARGDGRTTRAALAATSAARVAACADGIPRSPRLACAAIRGISSPARDTRWTLDRCDGSRFSSTSRAIRCRRARAGSTRRRRRRRARVPIERRAGTRARSRDSGAAGVCRWGSVRAGASPVFVPGGWRGRRTPSWARPRRRGCP